MPKIKSKKKRSKISSKGLEKALRSIKVLILDIDGVLTDCRVIYTEPAGFGAIYSVTDGFGIKLLLRNGIEVCFISAGNFTSHKKRAEVLGIRHAYFGNEDKLHSFEKICRDLSVQPEECAYMGDELFDIPVLDRVGFAACPPHSTKKVLECVHYVTKNPGGGGAVREICDAMLRGRGIDV
jgi:3-deoxy-D-manno-octulosonate 8-phosphate phosphatase (KDO 8-P phosphatase)